MAALVSLTIRRTTDVIRVMVFSFITSFLIQTTIFPTNFLRQEPQPHHHPSWSSLLQGNHSAFGVSAQQFGLDWVQLSAKLPIPLHTATTLVYNNTILIIGGCANVSCAKQLTSVIQFTPSKGEVQFIYEHHSTPNKKSEKEAASSSSFLGNNMEIAGRFTSVVLRGGWIVVSYAAKYIPNDPASRFCSIQSQEERKNLYVHQRNNQEYNHPLFETSTTPSNTGEDDDRSTSILSCWENLLNHSRYITYFSPSSSSQTVQLIPASEKTRVNASVINFGSRYVFIIGGSRVNINPTSTTATGRGKKEKEDDDGNPPPDIVQFEPARDIDVFILLDPHQKKKNTRPGDGGKKEGEEGVSENNDQEEGSDLLEFQFIPNAINFSSILSEEEARKNCHNKNNISCHIACDSPPVASDNNGIYFLCFASNSVIGLPVAQVYAIYPLLPEDRDENGGKESNYFNLSAIVTKIFDNGADHSLPLLVDGPFPNSWQLTTFVGQLFVSRGTEELFGVRQMSEKAANWPTFLAQASTVSLSASIIGIPELTPSGAQMTFYTFGGLAENQENSDYEIITTIQTLQPFFRIPGPLNFLDSSHPPHYEFPVEIDLRMTQPASANATIRFSPSLDCVESLGRKGYSSAIFVPDTTWVKGTSHVMMNISQHPPPTLTMNEKDDDINNHSMSFLASPATASRKKGEVRKMEVDAKQEQGGGADFIPPFVYICYSADIWYKGLITSNGRAVRWFVATNVFAPLRLELKSPVTSPPPSSTTATSLPPPSTSSTPSMTTLVPNSSVSPHPTTTGPSTTAPPSPSPSGFSKFIRTHLPLVIVCSSLIAFLLLFLSLWFVRLNNRHDWCPFFTCCLESRWLGIGKRRALYRRLVEDLLGPTLHRIGQHRGGESFTTTTTKRNSRTTASSQLNTIDGGNEEEEEEVQNEDELEIEKVKQKIENFVNAIDLSRYEVIMPLGQGGNGQVYLLKQKGYYRQLGMYSSSPSPQLQQQRSELSLKALRLHPTVAGKILGGVTLGRTLNVRPPQLHNNNSLGHSDLFTAVKYLECELSPHLLFANDRASGGTSINARRSQRLSIRDEALKEVDRLKELPPHPNMINILATRIDELYYEDASGIPTIENPTASEKTALLSTSQQRSIGRREGGRMSSSAGQPQSTVEKQIEGGRRVATILIFMPYCQQGDLKNWSTRAYRGIAGGGGSAISSSYTSASWWGTRNPSSSVTNSVKAISSTTPKAKGKGGCSPAIGSNKQGSPTTTTVGESVESQGSSRPPRPMPSLQLMHYTQCPMSEHILASIAFQICSVLAHLHQHEVVHCDIKPENILVLDHIPFCYMETQLSRLASMKDEIGRMLVAGHMGEGTRKAKDVVRSTGGAIQRFSSSSGEGGKKQEGSVAVTVKKSTANENNHNDINTNIAQETDDSPADTIKSSIVTTTNHDDEHKKDILEHHRSRRSESAMMSSEMKPTRSSSDSFQNAAAGFTIPAGQEMKEGGEEYETIAVTIIPPVDAEHIQLEDEQGGGEKMQKKQKNNNSQSDAEEAILFSPKENQQGEEEKEIDEKKKRGKKREDDDQHHRTESPPSSIPSNSVGTPVTMSAQIYFSIDGKYNAAATRTSISPASSSLPSPSSSGKGGVKSGGFTSPFKFPCPYSLTSGEVLSRFYQVVSSSSAFTAAAGHEEAGAASTSHSFISINGPSPLCHSLGACFLPVVLSDFGLARKSSSSSASGLTPTQSAGTQGPSQLTMPGQGAAHHLLRLPSGDYDVTQQQPNMKSIIGNTMTTASISFTNTNRGFTLPYVSPELVASGMLAVSAKSDMWALGCVLYRFATMNLLSLPPHFRRMRTTERSNDEKEENEEAEDTDSGIAGLLPGQHQHHPRGFHPQGDLDNNNILDAPILLFEEFAKCGYNTKIFLDRLFFELTEEFQYSEAFGKFMCRLLHPDPRERISAKDALEFLDCPSLPFHFIFL